ncbi:VOC family protein [Piscinibacter gummiphilus]|uniref:Glyoxalase n=1 Tax=Piscinibacter gummiphilus TaxID=946333 RepID=A0A1W6LCN9_9BURK|nr:VOC family protein [Piscinibacter gummiphilus]ARN21977.1 glyoxalase [Piscinibacter gummiphilus]ATU66662.1 VOC family protein [Piscinibacter gummiphilus]GLS94048.1 hypothetical protein GCM10007918_13400 [Piscinibacter gummiphilus]
MLSHIFVSVQDFDRALKFYTGLMSLLGNELRFSEPDRPWAGWHSVGASRPFFVICKPYNGEPHDPGNGQMVAFLARERADVAAAHTYAVDHGGTSEGLPGLRPEYHPNYYGAYFRDTEGNKLCVACHESEGPHA